MILRPTFTPAPSIKILINIGALLDIPTGFYLTGKYGESILNGGLGALTGVVAIGNNFKSTIMHYMMLSAASKISYATDTSMSTYDTEINIHEHTLNKFAKKIDLFAERDVLADGTWTITDKTIYYANEWFELLKEFLNHKKKNHDKIMVETPFIDRDGKLLRIITPTFGEVDSLSEFETADVAKIKDDNELGESGGNTIHMRQGLAKTRFLMDMPILSNANYHFMLITGQIGKQLQIATGPIPQAPTKKLNYLKNGDTIKGVTDKFTFLMSNCWHAYNATPLLNQSTKGPEYPRNPDDNTSGDTDLNIVSLRQLRSKSGPSGIVIDIIVSQSEGVLADLTEFHYIKNEDRFGISGTLQHYALDLMPDVKLSRTTIRSKLNENPKIRRALNITSELCQMKNLWRDVDKSLLCEPKELYQDLINLGYDWDVLLNTRGWWTINNDKQPIPFLSTMDLLKMRKNLYYPYWLAEDKKTVKPI